ncbi:hypothetical protein BH09SUM1_BH09SUM1_25410 [soil metagenome]
MPDNVDTARGDSVHVGDPDGRGRSVSPWAWIPTVYFAQGLQYSVVVQLFAIAFFTMGVSPGDTLFWVGIISFPYTIKPLWGPLVDTYGTKRTWTWLMQLTVGSFFVLAAGSLLLGNAIFFGLPLFMAACVVVLTLLAFGAATHDIACDGFYMLGLNERKQAFFVGMRSAFFQAAMMFANGALIWMAGSIQSATGLPTVEASITAHQANAAKPNADDLTSLAPWPASAQEAIQIMPPTLEATAGEIAYMTVRLSAAPPQDAKRVVVLRLKDGSQGISIPKDFERLDFTAENWREGIDVPVITDARLHGEHTETITAQAGNIPLSWSLVALLTAAIFLSVALWHRFILPYPASDAARETANRPPFLTAVLYLALTVGIPFLACWGFVRGADLLRDSVRTAVIGNVSSPALQDLRGLLQPSHGNAVSVDDLWSSIDGMRTSGAASDAAGLGAAVALRHTLSERGILTDPKATAELAGRLAEIQSDPAVYGSPTLKHIQVLARALSDGAAPVGESGFRSALAKATNPGLDRFTGEESADRLSALSAVESAGGGKVPQTRADLDVIAESAKATPSKLTVKGFDAFYSFGRLALLCVLVGVVLSTPLLWQPISGAAQRASNKSGIGFAEVFATFFAKPGIAVTLAFLLTYRLGKSQLNMLKNIFLLDARGSGGLGLSLGDVALINSTTYLGLMTVGALLGGMVVAKIGLRRAIWPMVACMHLPSLLYLYLSMTQPTNLLAIHAAVGLEALGNGFGFTSFLVIMMIAAQGPYKTAHYALCTGVMALGAMIPGMVAGYLQELVGYNLFFILVLVFSLPGVILIPFLKLDMTFGEKK